MVGVQPFGGHGLSGTGPKAGGPLYLRAPAGDAAGAGAAWRGAAGGAALGRAGWPRAARPRRRRAARRCASARRSGVALELPGPVGERNTWSLEPRGDVLCLPATALGLALQVGAALATGNRALVALPPGLQRRAR